MMYHSKENIMKKALVAISAFLVVGTAVAQHANCWQQYVCGGGGCQWITICR
jgi:hypothetical protein